jgi:hypothetical protein
MLKISEENKPQRGEENEKHLFDQKPLRRRLAGIIRRLE